MHQAGVEDVGCSQGLPAAAAFPEKLQDFVERESTRLSRERVFENAVQIQSRVHFGGKVVKSRRRRGRAGFGQINRALAGISRRKLRRLLIVREIGRTRRRQRATFLPLLSRVFNRLMIRYYYLASGPTSASRVPFPWHLLHGSTATTTASTSLTLHRAAQLSGVVGCFVQASAHRVVDADDAIQGPITVSETFWAGIRRAAKPGQVVGVR